MITYGSLDLDFYLPIRDSEVEWEEGRLKDSPTLVELLERRVQNDPDGIAYRFLNEYDETVVSYAQLRERVVRVATDLRRHRLAGERALLLFPPGLDYVAAFFGCLYAGVVAVPAYPPQGKRGLPRLNAVIEDARAAAALTTAAFAGPMQSHLPQELAFIVTDQGPDQTGSDPFQPGEGIDPEGLAFLQYTSGSTRSPRGVMLSHANLMHNLEMMHQWFGQPADGTSEVAVSWLPPYHDMGLIGGILEPVYGGFPAVLMSPVDFLQRPQRWLEAISRYRGTVSAAPNFAYELCTRKATDADREALDLSSWRVAVNGSEPVHGATLDRFTEAFAAQGFQPTAFRPAYGLAEATLLVTADPAGAPTQRRTIGGTERVGCGRALGDQTLAVVDAVSLRPVAPGEEGELWLAGPSVARGYWGRHTETEALFRATLPGGSGPYLRTGDLGVLDDAGQLFVTGRRKDLIIIGGRNIYPQDVEHAAAGSHPALRRGCGAAIGLPDADGERLVLVQEASPEADLDAVAVACRGAVRAECDVDLDELVLIEPRTIPKTSSGKIQRNACRTAYLAGQLAAVGQWRAGEATTAPYEGPRDPVEELLAEICAQLLAIEKVGIHDDFFTFGGQSMLANQLVARIQEQLPVRVSLGDIFTAPTVAELAALLRSRALTVDAEHIEKLLSDLEADQMR